MEHEIMNYRDFCNLLKQFTELRHAAELVTCPMDVLTKREELKQEIQAAFCDAEDNLSRWEKGEKCTFVDPETGKRIFLAVGKDAETLYRFLLYCREIVVNHRVLNEYKTYLAHLLAAHS